MGGAISLLAVNFIALMEWAGASLLQIDIPLDVSRELVFATSEAWPFGKGIYFVEAFYAIGLALVAMAFLVLNASLVYEIYRRHTLGRNISLAV